MPRTAQITLQIIFLSRIAFGAGPAEALRMQTLPLAGGAELVTVFGKVPDAGRAGTETPLLSVLRDGLGDSDPANDKLGYVWLHSYARRPLGRKILAGLPFVYLTGGAAPAASRRAPEPLLDLETGPRGAWHGLLWESVQSFWLDPSGVALRAPTRSFRGNAGDFRSTRLAEAAALLARVAGGQAETCSSVASGGEAGVRQAEACDAACPNLTTAELRDLQARLLLAGTLLGGLVNDRTLPKVYERDAEKTHLNRGRNWELLRQRAEKNRLYFEPLGDAGGEPSHAMLWIAKSDLFTDAHPFDGKFLGIADPWRDARVKRWSGYTETWRFDADNRKLAAGMEGARSEEMIPLALYGLDFPKVPLLAIDFRDQSKPRKREVRNRAATDVTRGVLGLSRFAYWEVFAAQAAADFVAGRWGAAVSRPARLRAYAGLREFVRADASLRPGLREELARRVTALSTNPLDYKPEGEAELARSQYAALVKQVTQAGFAKKLDADRREELTRTAHGLAARAWLHTLHATSLGLYRHQERLAEPLLERVDRERRIAYHKRLLEEASASGPRLDVAWDAEKVRASVRELRRLTEGTPAWPGAAALVNTVEPRLPEAAAGESRQSGE